MTFFMSKQKQKRIYMMTIVRSILVGVFQIGEETTDL